MKKFISLFLSIVVVVSSVACSKQDEIVEITLPAFIYSQKTDQEIEEEAQSYNCISYDRNDDGTVTYTMTESSHKEIVENIEAEIHKTMEETLDEQIGVDGFEAIEYTEDYTRFNLHINPAVYSDFYVVYAYSYFVSGVYYQMYTGVAEDDIDVLVTFKNSQTGEVLNAGTYRNLLEAYN